MWLNNGLRWFNVRPTTLNLKLLTHSVSPSRKIPIAGFHKYFYFSADNPFLWKNWLPQPVAFSWSPASPRPLPSIVQTPKPMDRNTWSKPLPWSWIPNPIKNYHPARSLWQQRKHRGSKGLSWLVLSLPRSSFFILHSSFLVLRISIPPTSPDLNSCV